MSPSIWASACFEWWSFWSSPNLNCSLNLHKHTYIYTHYIELIWIQHSHPNTHTLTRQLSSKPGIEIYKKWWCWVYSWPKKQLYLWLVDVYLCWYSLKIVTEKWGENSLICSRPLFSSSASEAKISSLFHSLLWWLEWGSGWVQWH